VPFTRKAGMPSNFIGELFIDKGLECVTACPIEDCSTSGATTVTSPNFKATLANAAMPGLYMPSSFDIRILILFHFIFSCHQNKWYNFMMLYSINLII
jgi:hypothetical protein